MGLKQHIQHLITRDRDLQQSHKGVNDLENKSRMEKKAEAEAQEAALPAAWGGWDMSAQAEHAESWNDGDWQQETWGENAEEWPHVGALKGAKGKGKRGQGLFGIQQGQTQRKEGKRQRKRLRRVCDLRGAGPLEERVPLQSCQ